MKKTNYTFNKQLLVVALLALALVVQAHTSTIANAAGKTTAIAANYSALLPLNNDVNNFDQSGFRHTSSMPGGSVTPDDAEFLITSSVMDSLGQSQSGINLSIVTLPTIALDPQEVLDCSDWDFQNYEWMPFEVCASVTNYLTVQWTTSGDGYFDNATSTCTYYVPGPIDAWDNNLTLTITAVGSGTTNNVASANQLVIIPKQIIQIESDGWQGISCYVDNSTMSVAEVLAPITESLISIENQSGQQYNPSLGTNTLGNWDAIGYKAHFSASCCLPLYGPLLEDKTFAITNKTTYLPVLSDIPVLIDELFANDTTEVQFIYNWETQQMWYSPNIYSFNMLEPGKAYLLTTVSENPNFTITFPQQNTLAITPSSRSVAASGGTTTFTVTTNSQWHALSDQPWCSANMFGAGDGIITAEFTGNTSATSRVANITVSAVGTNPKTVTLTQAGIASTDIISLNPGWNLISLDVIPNPATPATVFASLITANNLVMVTGFQNQQGKFFDPTGLPFLNTLQIVVPGEGYWVKVTNATTLNVTGEAISSNFTFNLKSGWNLVAYWPQETTTPEAAFDALITADILEIVTGYEQGGLIFDPDQLPFLNTLIEIKNGFGYWVKVSEDYDGFSFPVVAWQCGSNFTDSRDGNVYTTVQIGTQCWMKQNLNIGTRIDGIGEQTNNGTIEKYCYDNIESNCDVYGGLYQWDEMMHYSVTPGVQGICPTNWHLPTDAEWTEFTTYLGGGSVAGGKMKETGTTHWASPNTGATNSSGFTGLPAGRRYSGGYFNYLGYYARLWSSTEFNGSYAWYRYLDYGNSYVNRYYDSKVYGFSVRCIKD